MKPIEYGSGLSKAEMARIAEGFAAKAAKDRAARAEGRPCACEGPHRAGCGA